MLGLFVKIQAVKKKMAEFALMKIFHLTSCLYLDKSQQACTSSAIYLLYKTQSTKHLITNDHLGGALYYQSLSFLQPLQGFH